MLGAGLQSLIAGLATGLGVVLVALLAALNLRPNDKHLGLAAGAIALHNIPERVPVAGPIRACWKLAHRSVAWAAASGLAEPAVALLVGTSITLFAPTPPLSLALAGRAMLYLIYDELILDRHSHGYQHRATFGLRPASCRWCRPTGCTGRKGVGIRRWRPANRCCSARFTRN